MKKRLTALFAAMALAVGMLSGCGGNGETSTNEGRNASVSQEKSGGSAENGENSGGGGQKVKLTALFVSHALTKSVEDMKWLQELEEECNVEIQWEQIYQDWETVKSTRFASGDIPDLLFNATIESDYTKYSGLFQDLTGLIASDGPNIQKMFEEEPNTKVLAATKEGKIFATPKFQGKWPKTNTAFFINQEWLDNVGKKMPTTLSELKDVLIAFRDQDANGNGDPGDEIPLDFNAYGGNNAWFNSAYGLLKLLGSMGIQMTDTVTNGYFVEDKTVKMYAIDDRYKLFMEYLADLYKEGLINSNAITNDYSAYQSLSRGNENGDAVVGACFGWEETDKFGPKLYTQYKTVGPLAYDIGVPAGSYETLWNDDYYQLNMAANRIAMSSKCENKEAAMRFMDAFYEKTHSVETLFGGISDGCIEQADENTYKVLPPQDADTDAGTWKWTNTFADFGPMYISQSTQIEMSEDMTNALEERTVYEEALSKATDENSYHQLFMKYSEADQNTLALTEANINNIIDNYWSLWLTGESDIQADWDKYVEEVKGAGLEEVLKIRQAAFDEYLNSK